MTDMPGTSENQPVESQVATPPTFGATPETSSAPVVGADHSSFIAGADGVAAAPITITSDELPAVTQAIPSAQVATAASTSPTWVYPTWTPEASATPASDSKSGRKSSTKAAVLAGILAGVIAGAGSAALVLNYNSGASNSISLPAAKGDTSARPDGSIADIAKRVLPTVVSIDVRSATAAGTGSGFVIKSGATSSYILTNNHVASGAGAGSTIKVVFQDETTAPATVVGTDDSYDLAVLKVDKGNLPVAVLGNSDDVVVGDSTIAIGSPLGLTGTVTSGIVSALNRPVTAGEQSQSFINAIQTDAAINPGNSGGPLVNAQGQVIGINSAIATTGSSSFGSTQSGSIGLGFAIPINKARNVAEQLINTGKSYHPIIGVSVDMNYTDGGAKVSDLTAGGPAEKAGIKIGDIITKVDGHAIADGTELIVRIRAHSVGDTVTLTLSNGTDVKVVLGSSAAQ